MNEIAKQTPYRFTHRSGHPFHTVPLKRCNSYGVCCAVHLLSETVKLPPCFLSQRLDPNRFTCYMVHHCISFTPSVYCNISPYVTTPSGVAPHHFIRQTHTACTLGCIPAISRAPLHGNRGCKKGVPGLCIFSCALEIQANGCLIHMRRLACFEFYLIHRVN